MTGDELRKEVLWGAKRIFAQGLVQAGEGNVSVRVPGKNELFITPTFNDYENFRVEEVAHIDFIGNRIGGNRAPSSEYRLHSAVYAARPRVGAIIHTHSPYATMASVARTEIPVILEEMLIFLGGEIQVAEYGIANTDEIANNAIDALGKTNGILMTNHGSLVVGRNMEHAVKMAELVEKMSQVFLGAHQQGSVYQIPGKNWQRFLEKFEQDFATH